MTPWETTTNRTNLFSAGVTKEGRKGQGPARARGREDVLQHCLKIQFLPLLTCVYYLTRSKAKFSSINIRQWDMPYPVKVGREFTFGVTAVKRHCTDWYEI